MWVHPLGVAAEARAVPSPSSAFQKSVTEPHGANQGAETRRKKERIPERASIQKKTALFKDQTPRRQKPWWLQGNREGHHHL